MPGEVWGKSQRRGSRKGSPPRLLPMCILRKIQNLSSTGSILTCPQLSGISSRPVFISAPSYVKNTLFSSENPLPQSKYTQPFRCAPASNKFRSFLWSIRLESSYWKITDGIFSCFRNNIAHLQIKVEDKFCILRNMHIGSNLGGLDIYNTNSSEVIGDMYYFKNTDPWLCCCFEGRVVRWIEISGKILLLSDNTELGMVEDIAASRKYRAEKVLLECQENYETRESRYFFSASFFSIRFCISSVNLFNIFLCSSSNSLFKLQNLLLLENYKTHTFLRPVDEKINDV